MIVKCTGSECKHNVAGVCMADSLELTNMMLTIDEDVDDCDNGQVCQSFRWR